MDLGLRCEDAGLQLVEGGGLVLLELLDLGEGAEDGCGPLLGVSAELEEVFPGAEGVACYLHQEGLKLLGD